MKKLLRILVLCLLLSGNAYSEIYLFCVSTVTQDNSNRKSYKVGDISAVHHVKIYNDQIIIHEESVGNKVKVRKIGQEKFNGNYKRFTIEFKLSDENSEMIDNFDFWDLDTTIPKMYGFTYIRNKKKIYDYKFASTCMSPPENLYKKFIKKGWGSLKKKDRIWWK